MNNERAVRKENEIIAMALQIMEGRLRYSSTDFESPTAALEYFTLRLGEKEHEVFSVAFLDARHRLIECKDMFTGTIDGASVYPREIMKEALNQNAAAIILAHNHPSGDATPSHSDRALTDRVRGVMQLVDVRVLDHIVVGAESVSMTKMGYM